jgi:glycerophosphoryl diester phosphodiesterase
MEIIGHRGARGLAPANSLAAFKAGIAAGVDWVEFDVRTTKDGRIVLLHDSHTLRTTLKPHIVSRTKYSKLKQLKTYSGQPIITIAQAFKYIGLNAKINIEIKNKGCAETVVQNIEKLVKAGANYDRFLVSSFSVSRLREVHRLNNKVQLGLLHGANPYKFLNLRGLRVQAVGFYHRTITTNIVHQARLRELKIYAYTVNKLPRAKQLAELGVNSIVTDRPDKLASLKD